MESKLEIERSN